MKEIKEYFYISESSLVDFWLLKTATIAVGTYTLIKVANCYKWVAEAKLSVSDIHKKCLYKSIFC